MASRRDELNAYTSARKRTVGAFLLPSGGGNDEDAPRPVKAVLPSVVIAVVIVAGFAMWGVIKPAAPKGWGDGNNIIQGKQSATRYVILPSTDPKRKGEKVLHQVLNISSAKLVLPANAKVVFVADKVLDAYPHHGATIGIPYAPDKLPTSAVAGTEKFWSVCNRPGSDQNKPPNQAVFVAADADAKRLTDAKLLLGPGQSMYVEGPLNNGAASRYLIDNQGIRHVIGQPTATKNERNQIAGSLFGSDQVENPQRVTQEWLDTLDAGEAIKYKLPDDFKDDKVVDSKLRITSNKAAQRVGRVVQYDRSYFMVGTTSLYAISPFQAHLAISDARLAKVYDNKKAEIHQLTAADYAALKDSVDPNAMKDTDDMPNDEPAELAVNVKDRTVLCSTFMGMGDGGKIKRTVWADTRYPADVPTGAASARVSPGHGVLFKGLDDLSDLTSGFQFLITETGLRYPVPTGNDGGKKGSTASAEPKEPEQQEQANANQARLGFEKVTAVPVPMLWAKLVPIGPVLSKDGALQAQHA